MLTCLILILFTCITRSTKKLFCLCFLDAVVWHEMLAAGRGDMMEERWGWGRGRWWGWGWRSHPVCLLFLLALTIRCCAARTHNDKLNEAIRLQQGLTY